MKKFVRHFIALSIVLLLAAGAVYLYYLPMPKPGKDIGYKEVARQLTFSGDGSLSAWDEKKLAKKATNYSVVDIEGKTVLKALSEGGASGLYLKERLSHRDRPYVKWVWKVVKFPGRKEKETLDSKKEFDFAAQFYVLFYSRMIMSTKAIQYVWAEELPVGTARRSPYTDNVKILVLQSGETGEWKTEERDILADYKELFGKELDKDVDAVAFMTDADSTDTTAEAYLSEVELGFLPAVGKEVQEGK